MKRPSKPLLESLNPWILAVVLKDKLKSSAKGEGFFSQSPSGTINISPIDSYLNIFSQLSFSQGWIINLKIAQEFHLPADIKFRLGFIVTVLIILIRITRLAIYYPYT